MTCITVNPKGKSPAFDITFPGDGGNLLSMALTMANANWVQEFTVNQGELPENYNWHRLEFHGKWVGVLRK